MYKKVKSRIFSIIQVAEDGDRASKIFDIFIMALILLNVATIILETFTETETERQIIARIESVSVVIFTIEYFLRVWTANLLFPQYSTGKAILKYIFSFMAIIDLLAILPFYIPFLIPIDLRVLRLLRLLRLFRLFKFNRYTAAFATIAEVFKRKSAHLISSVLVVGLLMIISSILMYNVEHEVQPDVFKNAFSGLWWAVATFTTVGYGDIYPVTAMGKVLSSIIALLGIGLVAVPTGIISAGFIEIMDDHKQHDEKAYCPFCGHKLD